MGCSGYMGGYTGARVALVAIDYLMTKGNQGGFPKAVENQVAH